MADPNFHKLAIEFAMKQYELNRRSNVARLDQQKEKITPPKIEAIQIFDSWDELDLQLRKERSK